MDDRQTRHAMSLDDAYVVERVLARGPHGTTELVTLDGAGPFVRKRIPRAEAHRMVWSALAECGSPYLPRVRAMYDLPDDFVAICDYVPGETLAERMDAAGRCSLDEAAAVLGTLCDAVAELHEHQVIHADIAPSNVVLAEDGAHLIDFGSARMAFDAPRDHEPAWGTRGFAAPEQHGFAPPDARSDIYALGRLAGYLLTGTHLDERTFEAALRCSGLVPEAVCRVLGRACAFEPSARFQTAGDFMAAFSAACAGDEGAAADGSDATRPPAMPDEVAPARQHAGQAQAPVKARRRMPARRAAAIAAGIVLVGALAVAAAWTFTAGPLSSHGGSAQPAASGDADGGTAAAGAGASVLDASAALAAAGSSTADPGDSASLGTDASSLIDEAVAGIEITESTWRADSAGYVHYAVAITNATEDVISLFPEVVITGRDATGRVLFADTQVLSDLFPGQTRYWGSFAGNGTLPADVAFSLSRPSDWEVQRATGGPSTFTVSHMSTSRDVLGNLIVAGEVALDARGGESYASGSVMVVAVGRDERGNLVFCEAGYASAPAEGETVPFEVTVQSSAPNYDSIEAYAYPW